MTFNEFCGLCRPWNLPCSVSSVWTYGGPNINLKSPNHQYPLFLNLSALRKASSFILVLDVPVTLASWISWELDWLIFFSFQNLGSVDTFWGSTQNHPFGEKSMGIISRETLICTGSELSSSIEPSSLYTFSILLNSPTTVSLSLLIWLANLLKTLSSNHPQVQYGLSLPKMYAIAPLEFCAFKCKWPSNVPM